MIPEGVHVVTCHMSLLRVQVLYARNIEVRWFSSVWFSEVAFWWKYSVWATLETTASNMSFLLLSGGPRVTRPPGDDWNSLVEGFYRPCRVSGYSVSDDIARDAKFWLAERSPKRRSGKGGRYGRERSR